MVGIAQTFTYDFLLPNDKKIAFTVGINPITGQINTCPLAPPAWARLEFHQCQSCPLQQTEHPFCPIALSISDLVTTFKDTASYVPCTVTCTSRERTVYKKTTVQEGLASILGLLMAISGCPVMIFFKPLARFHLPFSTVEESLFRIVAVCLLGRYFRRSDCHDTRFDLRDLKNHYSLVQQINKGILQRIQNITELDADNNAIITLTSLGQILELEIDTHIESLHHLFNENGDLFY